MNLLNISGYTSAVSHLGKRMAQFERGLGLLNQDVHRHSVFKKYIYRCPIVTSYFLVCGFQSKTFEFRGVELFDEFDVLKKVIPGASFFVEQVLTASDPRNSASVEALHHFYRVSDLTFSKIDEAIATLSSDMQSLVSRDRLFIAATSLLLTNVFPSKFVEMSKPLIKMTDFNQVNLRLSETLNVEHLLTDAPIVNLYPEGLERRILSRVRTEMTVLLQTKPLISNSY